jgi:hypothetical protein
MGKNKNVYRFLVGNPERKRPLRRSRCRWKDNIKRGMGSIHLARDRDQWWALVITVMNIQVP